MARTRRTIPLDEKIEKAQELVFQIKDKYDAAVEELNKLIKKKQELQRQEFARGIIVPTEEIHHKKPLSEGGTHDRSNLIALCKSCHSQIHAKRGDYWGGRG